MSMLPLNSNQYGLILEKLKSKDENNTVTDVELLILDLCSRVEYLENENRKIRKFAKKKKVV